MALNLDMRVWRCSYRLSRTVALLKNIIIKSGSGSTVHKVNFGDIEAIMAIVKLTFKSAS